MGRRAPGRTQQVLQGLSSSTPDDGRAPGALPGLSELPSPPGCWLVLPAALFPSLLKAGPASSADFPRAGRAGPPAELSPRLAWTDLCSPPPHRGHRQPAGCVWELQGLWGPGPRDARATVRAQPSRISAPQHFLQGLPTGPISAPRGLCAPRREGLSSPGMSTAGSVGGSSGDPHPTLRNIGAPTLVPADLSLLPHNSLLN